MKVLAAFIGVVLVWSTTPLAISWSLGEASPIYAAMVRMFLGALICRLWLLASHQALPWHRKAWLSYATGSLSLFAGMMLTYLSMPYLPSGLVSVLFGLSPLVTALLAAWLLDEAFGWAQLVALLLGFIGLALVFQVGSELPAGAYYGIGGILGAVVLFSLSTVLTKKLQSGLSALAMTCGTLTLSSVAYFSVWLIWDRHLPVFVLKEQLSILYLAIFGSVLGFVWYYYALVRIGASRLALITLITPVMALLLGHGLNAEPVLPQAWLGCGCILLALVCYQWSNSVSARRSLAG